MSSTGCVCDQTQPPPRLTKLTQTWKTERSILTPIHASCPRPPLPLLVAALQGVVETMKGKWKSDPKISLNMFGCQMRGGRRRWFYQPPTPHASIVLECWRSGRRADWGCETVGTSSLSPETSEACGDGITANIILSLVLRSPPRWGPCGRQSLPLKAFHMTQSDYDECIWNRWRRSLQILNHWINSDLQIDLANTVDLHPSISCHLIDPTVLERVLSSVK